MSIKDRLAADKSTDSRIVELEIARRNFERRDRDAFADAVLRGQLFDVVRELLEFDPSLEYSTHPDGLPIRVVAACR